MQKMRWWAAALATSLALHAHASEELALRSRVQAEVQAQFAAGDYKAIEERYASARASGARTPSGLFVANLVRKAVIALPDDRSDDPGRNNHWNPIERKLQDWNRQFPQSTLAAVSLSDAYMGHGWSWRGGGYARTVSPEGLKKFREYAQQAYEALMAREKLGRSDPYWYVQMLNIAQFQGWPMDRYMTLVREATQAFPLDYEVYFAIAYRLQPRWGGSVEAIAQFADFAVKQTRHVEGESMYARIYWAVGDRIDTELSGPEVNWERIRAGFDDVVKRYPDTWNLNNYARMACQARDLNTTRRVLLRIRGDVEPRAWQGRAQYLRCVDATGLKREELQ